MTSGRTTGWCSPPGSERRSTPRNILRTIQVAAQKAAMSDIGVHTLRDSAAVAWLETGSTHQGHG